MSYTHKETHVLTYKDDLCGFVASIEVSASDWEKSQFVPIGDMLPVGWIEVIYASKTYHFHQQSCLDDFIEREQKSIPSRVIVMARR